MSLFYPLANTPPNFNILFPMAAKQEFVVAYLQGDIYLTSLVFGLKNYDCFKVYSLSVIPPVI